MFLDIFPFPCLRSLILNVGAQLEFINKLSKSGFLESLDLKSGNFLMAKYFFKASNASTEATTKTDRMALH